MVGVILNLAVWFALHVLFGRVRLRLRPRLELPVPASLDPAALVLTVGAVVAVFRLRLGMSPLLAGWAAWALWLR